jgi:hypothetical protein
LSSIRKEINKIIDDLPEEHLLELKQLIQKFIFVKDDKTLNQEALDFLFENYDKTLRNLKDM